MACSSEPLEPSDVAGEEPGEPSPFAPCPLFTDTGEGQAECAIFERPLITDDPSAGTIPFFVKRVRATEPRRGQLWILPGGPGASSQAYEGWLADRAQQLPDLDIYVPDHRGTGNSELLACDADRDECGALLREQWGDNLRGFRTTEAARDVAAAIRATRAPGDQVLVHGASYGGYWLNRLLAVDPEVADAAVFESSSRVKVLPGGATELARGPEQAGRRLFELCASDPDCRERLGDDGYARARALLDHLDDCEHFFYTDPLNLTSTLGTALGTWRTRELIPAFVHRAERCAEADGPWLQTFLRAVIQQWPSTDEPPELFNSVLNWHVQASESFGPIDEAELVEVQSTTVFNRSTTYIYLGEDLEDWPRYDADEYSDRFANVDIPVLVIHGGLDSTTAISGARQIADEVGPRVTFLELPSAEHGVDWWPEGTYCGRDLILQFLKAPERPIDDGCIAEAPPFTFTSDPEWLLDTFGSDDLWGD